MNDAQPAGATALTDDERAILDFEAGRHWIYPGAKEDEIRRRFDISPTRYYQRLHALVGDDRALAYKPVLIKRLRRLEEARRRHRKVG